MEIIRDFDPIDTSETDAFYLEFTGDLPAGVLIPTPPVFSCTVISTEPGCTVDASPATRLKGLASVAVSIVPVSPVYPNGARTFATQLVGTMVEGNRYRLTATVTTSDGRTLSLYSHVLCKGLE
jgi:hypothetical protein